MLIAVMSAPYKLLLKNLARSTVQSSENHCGNKHECEENGRQDSHLR